MKKNDIKSDLIHDKIIYYANLITNNPKKVWSYLGIFLIVSSLIVFWDTKTDNKEKLYNSYSSNNQNNYIDNNKDLALLGFDNMITNYTSSESYNQAFIYSLSSAIDNKDYNKIRTLLEDNKFSSDDQILNSLYYKIKGDYFFNTDNYNNAIESYEDALNYTNILDHLINIKLNLINIYLINEEIDSAEKILEDIDINELSYASKNKIDNMISRIEYMRK